MTTRLTSALNLLAVALTAAWTGLCLHRAWREQHPRPLLRPEPEPHELPGYAEAHRDLYDDLRGPT